jgi:hypothetical protein
MILYNCPDIRTKSSGINRIYRHVKYLCDNGFDAAVLHSEPSFSRADKPGIPVRYLGRAGDIQVDDIVIIPEGAPQVMKELSNAPVRRFVLALSWKYIYTTLPLNEDWRTYGIERLLVSCQYIGDMIGWAMSLPAHFIENSIEPTLYYPEFELNQKKKKVIFIKRKGELVPLLVRVLQSRNPRFLRDIEWLAMDDLPEEEYAAHLREATLFINTSKAEGILNASFQAMRCNTLVAGFDSIGGQGTICGDGDDANYLIAQTGDYLSLAWLIEPLLNDLLEGDMSNWEKQKENGYQLAVEMTEEKERESVLSFWKRIAPEHKKLEGA